MADDNEKDALVCSDESGNQAQPVIDSTEEHENDTAGQQAREAGSNDIIQSIPDVLPVLPVRDVVIFNYMILPLFISRESSVRAVDAALKNGRCCVFLPVYSGEEQ